MGVDQKDLKKEEYRWSLIADMAEYANENSEKFILDKAVKEAILLKLPRPGNTDPVKKLNDFLLELLKQKKKIVDITIDGTFEKNSREGNRYYGPIIQIMGYD